MAMEVAAPPPCWELYGNQMKVIVEGSYMRGRGGEGRGRVIIMTIYH